MPRAIPQCLREEIVWRRQQGQSLPAIARALGVKLGTVRGLWRRYQERGAGGLAHSYARCGRPGPRFPSVLQQAALTLKREHPTWSARRVWLQLQEQYPQQPLPGPRTLQRWFQVAGLQPAHRRHGPVARLRDRVPHVVEQTMEYSRSQSLPSLQLPVA